MGEALIQRHDLNDEFPRWGTGNTANRELRLAEIELERKVSDYLRDLPFLWVNVDDEPGPDSDRAFLERNAIALLSNFAKEPMDSRGDAWLGNDSPREKIREAGLWNIDHVDESYDPEFLDRLERTIEETTAP